MFHFRFVYLELGNLFQPGYRSFCNYHCTLSKYSFAVYSILMLLSICDLDVKTVFLYYPLTGWTCLNRLHDILFTDIFICNICIYWDGLLCTVCQILISIVISTWYSNYFWVFIFLLVGSYALPVFICTIDIPLAYMDGLLLVTSYLLWHSYHFHTLYIIYMATCSQVVVT